MSQDSPAQNQAEPAGETDDDVAYDYDVLVVGSGFGGAVSALRLTEKGYRVGVLRRAAASPPAPPQELLGHQELSVGPALGLFGIQRVHLLGNVMVLAGAGVGGGSLNYANTLYVPPAPFFEDRQWAAITDWQDELAPYYDQAKRMLGVRLNPTMTPSDVHLKATAQAMGSATPSISPRSASSSATARTPTVRRGRSPVRRSPTRTSAARGLPARPAPSAANA